MLALTGLKMLVVTVAEEVRAQSMIFGRVKNEESDTTHITIREVLIRVISEVCSARRMREVCAGTKGVDIGLTGP